MAKQERIEYKMRCSVNKLRLGPYEIKAEDQLRWFGYVLLWQTMELQKDYMKQRYKEGKKRKSKENKNRGLQEAEKRNKWEADKEMTWDSEKYVKL